MLLAFIYLRMELLWRSTPTGEVYKDLPFFKEFANKKYIKKLTVPLDRITQHAF
jgi:hypothetical protein